MDARQLAYVVAVVDHGGFTRAAEAVHVAQPSLSQAVRALEAELGVRLFDRLGRTVALTAAGEAILEPARQVQRDLATARAAVDAVRAVDAGHLDLICLPTLAVSPVADYVGAFRQAHTGVTVRLIEPEEAAAVADDVRSGRAEIGFTELPVDDARLVTDPLGVRDYVAVLPRGLASSDPVSLEELADLPLVTTTPGTSTRAMVDGAFAAAGRHPRIAIETDHREVITAMVRSGGGYSILPRSVAERIARRDARIVAVAPALTREVGMLRRPGRGSPAAEAFAAMVQQST